MEGGEEREKKREDTLGEKRASRTFMVDIPTGDEEPKCGIIDQLESVTEPGLYKYREARKNVPGRKIN